MSARQGVGCTIAPRLEVGGALEPTASREAKPEERLVRSKLGSRRTAMNQAAETLRTEEERISPVQGSAHHNSGAGVSGMYSLVVLEPRTPQKSPNQGFSWAMPPLKAAEETPVSFSIFSLFTCPHVAFCLSLPRALFPCLIRMLSLDLGSG